MQITRFVCNMVEENTYLVYDSAGQAALIDCGAFYKEEKEAIKKHLCEHDLRLKCLLNTHGHFDHLFGADFIYQEYGVKVQISHAERPTYEAAVTQMQAFMHRPLPLELPPTGPYLHEGDLLEVGSLHFEVIATPGHTPGGVCFYDSTHGVLFSGDSLFKGSIGRADLPGGNFQDLVQSLKTRILSLPDQVTVLPGHGPATTIGEERRNNPYLR